MGPAVEPAAQGRTELRAFDTLFRRALGADRELIAQLKSAGFDPDHPLPDYPSEIWVACLEAARRTLFADLSVDDGMRELGRRFAAGIQETPLGQVYSGVAFTAEAYLRRVPQQLRYARPDLEAEAHMVAERHWRIVIRGERMTPQFMAGLLEGRTRQRGLAMKAEIVVHSETEYDLVMTW